MYSSNLNGRVIIIGDFYRRLTVCILCFLTFAQVNASSEMLVNVMVVKVSPVHVPQYLNTFGSLFAKKKG
jgi:hypothetical protein